MVGPLTKGIAYNATRVPGNDRHAQEQKGNRIAALSESIKDDLHEWRNNTPNNTDEDWIFASENPKTPLWPTNVWHDKIRPTLNKLGLSWVNYQVLRRSTASLMNQLGIDGKTVSDQLGHTLDVSQNVYTQAGIKQQTNAVNKLDEAISKKTSTESEPSLESSGITKRDMKLADSA